MRTPGRENRQLHSTPSTLRGGPMSDDSGLSVSGPGTFRKALLMALIGLLVVGYGGYDYAQQSGALTDSVEVDAELTEKGVETTSGGSSSGVDHRPTVRFTYQYEGTSHTSTNVFPANIEPTYDTESRAESVLSGYETGETVTVYVPADDPDDAYLKHEASNTPLIAIGIGALLALFGGVSAWRRY